MEPDIIPMDRLRIFISSAQNNENGFLWIDVRKRIKEYLEDCPYLNPFIIEDVSSTVPSTQFFQYQVERSDVIVLLIKNEVRTGTSIEYALARKWNKPLLIYFLENGNSALKSLSVDRLKKDIQKSDYCTYCVVDSFDSIEVRIRNDIIEDVIRNFQDRHFSLSSEGNETISVAVENAERLSIFPRKAELNLFGSAYNHIFELLDIDYMKEQEEKDVSSFYSLGVALLDWLVLGSPIDHKSEILRFIDKTSEHFGNTDWLLKRWDAIRYKLSGNHEEALQAAQVALNLAKQHDLPQWIVNDILIDCRNMESEVNSIEGRYFTAGEAQKQLNQLDTFVYLPVLDRFLGNIHNGMVKEEFRVATASPYTELIGSNFNQVIRDVVNYFFYAALYGSFTHLVITRELLAQVLSKYAFLFESEELLFKCVQMYIVAGNSKDYKLFLKKNWDNAYSSVATRADEMWRLAENVLPISRDGMMLAVIETTGLYFSEQIFSVAEQYILDYEESVYWGNSETYFECLYENMTRLNQAGVAEKLTNIIVNRKFQIGTKLSQILIQLNLENVPIETQVGLKDALVKEIAFIVQNGGSPQLIAALVKQSPEIFKCLEDTPNNGLVGIEQKYYQINTGEGDWISILQEDIITAREQFEKNKAEGVCTYFATNPYRTISEVIRKSTEGKIVDISGMLLDEFVPLANLIINSTASTPTKAMCAACLCDVLSYFVQNGVSVPQSLIETLQQASLEKDTFSLFSENREDYEMRLLMAKIIVGLANQNELLRWCVNYSKKQVKERVVLADCIERYLYYQGNERIGEDYSILTLIFQCCNDDYYQVRNIASKCLCYILKNSKDGKTAMAEEKLYETAFDPSHYVRDNLVRLCKRELIPPELSRKILNTLAKDSNYGIRKHAGRAMA